MPLPKKTVGKDFDFFSLNTIISDEFGENANIAINIRGQQSFSIVNYGPNDIEYSFNGNVVHGDMRVGTPTEAIIFDNRRISGVWLRLITAGGSAEIRFEAWAHV